MRRPSARAAVAALLFAAADAVPAQPPAPVPQTNPAKVVVAAVDGEPITLADVDAVLARRPLLAAPLAAEQIRSLRAEAASDLVDDRLVRQFVRKYAPPVDPAEVDRQFAALVRQGKSLAALCRDAGQTEGQLRAAWATDLGLSRYVRGRVGDDQLRPYYAANKDRFDRTAVRARHIFVRAGAGPDREAARAKLAGVRADIVAGRAAFADAARKYSQCPSAADGGDLGTVTRTSPIVDDAVGRAAFALPVGGVSDLVETDSGVHLVTTTERKSGSASTFEGCRDDVWDAFLDDFRNDLVAKLRKQAAVKITIP